MAARVKLTAAEGSALVGIAVEKLGAAAVIPVLASALPADKVARLLRRESTPLTVAEKKALVEAVIPLLPGATPRQKISSVVKAIRPAFATRARYDEVMAYVNERVKLYFSGGQAAAAATGAVPPWDACTRASCWNGSNAQQRMMNVLSTGMPDATFDAYLSWMAGLGCNVAHAFVANLADGPHSSPGCSIYGTGKKWSWQPDAAVVAHFHARIAKIRARMAFVPWLMADESSLYFDAMIKNPEKYAADLASSGIFNKASFVCLGLESDEYASDSQMARLSAAVRAFYPGKIATHQMSGRWSFAKHGDLVMFQLDPGATPAKIAAEIKRVRAATGKPVCMFEMERRPASDAQIKAAFDAGAFQVANWNGTAAALFPATTSAPASAWPAELANVQWLHTNVRDWPATARLTASISGGQIRMPYDKANAWPAVDGVNANPWAIVQINGQCYAGTFEWFRKGQTSKPVAVLDGSKGDHFKVAPLNRWSPRSGERFYVMASGLARSTVRNVKERSDPVPVVWP